MKKWIVKGFLSTAVVLLLSPAPLALIAQGKNEIGVRDAKGTAIPMVSVHVFESKTGICSCFMGGCLVVPFDQDVTNKQGNAEFRGEKKNRPGLKPLTTYYASIDDKCTLGQQQTCNNAQTDCSFSANFTPFTTDDKGKFAGFNMTK